MGQGPPTIAHRSPYLLFLYHCAGFLGIFLLAMWLRTVPLEPDAELQGYLHVITGLLAIVFAALTFVRFQGTQDRIALILGAGYLLSGAVLGAASVLFFQMGPESHARLQWAPITWWVSRMLLAILLVAAILVHRFLPRSRHPRTEMVGTLLTVVGLTYTIAAALRHLPAESSRHPGAAIPNPLQLIPAALFVVALFGYRHRLETDDSPFDRGIYLAVWVNLAAQLAASQSQRLLDSPFVFAQALKVASYAIALGGALLDNSRLFDQVRHLAVSDPLTGLANYRRLLDVLEGETERTNRTSRPFAVLLLDLDGLKTINDNFGHLVGSRALCRLAETLRIHCRAIDTAARYGGDEFALVLPESEEREAQRVADRIRQVMAEDQETPKLSASIGIAVYRGNGERIEKLLSVADQHLYEQKSRRVRRNLPSLHPRRRHPTL